MTVAPGKSVPGWAAGLTAEAIQLLEVEAQVLVLDSLIVILCFTDHKLWNFRTLLNFLEIRYIVRTP